jgi:hypothetical protein
LKPIASSTFFVSKVNPELVAVSAGGFHVKRRPALFQSGPHLSRQVGWIALARHVHVEDRRNGPQHMIVQRRDLDAFREQLAHNRIDLAPGQHQVAHHDRGAAHGVEGQPAAERERRPEGDPVDGNVEVASRKPVSVHLVGDNRRPGEDRVNDRPVGLACLRVRGQSQAQTDDGGRKTITHDVSFLLKPPNSEFKSTHRTYAVIKY